MKRCKFCNRDKPLADFGKWSKSKDGHYYKCKECRNDYNRKYYASNPRRRQLVRKCDNDIRKRNKSNVLEYKKTHSCVDCGETEPLLLEFDHLRDKEHNLGDMVRCGYSWNRILAEIAKCEVVCVVCHRYRTRERLYGSIV